MSWRGVIRGLRRGQRRELQASLSAGSGALPSHFPFQQESFCGILARHAERHRRLQADRLKIERRGDAGARLERKHLAASGA